MKKLLVYNYAFWLFFLSIVDVQAKMRLDPNSIMLNTALFNNDTMQGFYNKSQATAVVKDIQTGNVLATFIQTQINPEAQNNLIYIGGLLNTVSCTHCKPKSRKLYGKLQSTTLSSLQAPEKTNLTAPISTVFTPAQPYEGPRLIGNYIESTQSATIQDPSDPNHATYEFENVEKGDITVPANKILIGSYYQQAGYNNNQENAVPMAMLQINLYGTLKATTPQAQPLGAYPATYAPISFTPALPYQATGLIGNYFENTQLATIHDPSGNNPTAYTFENVEKGGIKAPANKILIGSYYHQVGQNNNSTPIRSMAMLEINLYGTPLQENITKKPDHKALIKQSIQDIFNIQNSSISRTSLPTIPTTLPSNKDQIVDNQNPVTNDRGDQIPTDIVQTGLASDNNSTKTLLELPSAEQLAQAQQVTLHETYQKPGLVGKYLPESGRVFIYDPSNQVQEQYLFNNVQALSNPQMAPQDLQSIGIIMQPTESQPKCSGFVCSNARVMGTLKFLYGKLVT